MGAPKTENLCGPVSGGNSATICMSQRTWQVHSSEGTVSTPSKPDLVTTSCNMETTADSVASTDDPLQYFLPDSDDDAIVRVTQVCVHNKGSKPQTVNVVSKACLHVNGVVDTGADITIIGAEVFKRIAAVANLRKSDFKPPNKTRCTYKQMTFHIDSRVDLDVTFQGRTMKTPIYVKMDAREQLLLSEGVCRQLGIVTYHGDRRVV